MKLQSLIEGGEQSDLFDVLEYVSFSRPLISREARVETNRENIFNMLNEEQRTFVEFVLRNYVQEGVDELDFPS